MDMFKIDFIDKRHVHQKQENETKVFILEWAWPLHFLIIQNDFVFWNYCLIIIDVLTTTFVDSNAKFYYRYWWFRIFLFHQNEIHTILHNSLFTILSQQKKICFSDCQIKRY